MEGAPDSVFQNSDLVPICDYESVNKRMGFFGFEQELCNIYLRYTVVVDDD